MKYKKLRKEVKEQIKKDKIEDKCSKEVYYDFSGDNDVHAISKSDSLSHCSSLLGILDHFLSLLSTLFFLKLSVPLPSKDN